MDTGMEIGLFVLSEIVKEGVKDGKWKKMISFFKKKSPKENVFKKERFVLSMKPSMILNSEIRKELYLRFNFQNFHTNEIKIEKIKLTLCFESYLIAEFKESFSGYEQANSYYWKNNVDSTVMKNIERFFFQKPNNPEFYMSNGELKFNFKLQYQYGKETGEVEYDLFSFLEMDTRTHF